MKQTPLEEKISMLVTPVIEDLGFALFTVKIIGEGGSRTVQIMAEDPATGRLGIDDCTKITKAVSALLDVEDPIQGAYRLEISSPGIDRLLIRTEDFEKYTGFDAKLETELPNTEGQKRFRGVINGLKDGNIILLQTDTGEVEIPFSDLSKAKLVMSDALISATGKAVKKEKELKAKELESLEKGETQNGTVTSS
ncbi:MAG: ribosome maturation factor RimP [Alphaproteobacteria bacterium]|nr:ribosome maturation factor RimP [Alphaproteobacteria bacterium]MCD8570541.1 ribosome maturation factor RimP [Alphaproteobacteria bacterium]